MEVARGRLRSFPLLLEPHWRGSLVRGSAWPVLVAGQSPFSGVEFGSPRYSASTRGDFATTSLAGESRKNPGHRKRAFQVDCTKIWGNRYDYSRAKYKDNHTPVQVVCTRHGPFWIRPREHLQRRVGCPKCPAFAVAGLAQAKGAPPLGQHLLRSREIAEAIAKAALPEDEEPTSVAEIGVGAAALTQALLVRPSCRRLLGFEVDEEMVRRALRSASLVRVGASARPLPAEAVSWTRADWVPELRGLTSPGCVLFHGDFLRCRAVPGECGVVAGNLPYRISAALVGRLLLQWPPLRRIVVLVQAEFARRVLAQPSSPKYGRLSVLAALLCARREQLPLGRVPPEAFTPPPRVDSAVLCLTPQQAGLHRPLPLAGLDQLLRVLLDSARGQARGLNVEAVLAPHAQAAGWPPSWRTAVERAAVGCRPAVTLAPEDFADLALALEAAGCFQQLHSKVGLAAGRVSGALAGEEGESEEEEEEEEME